MATAREQARIAASHIVLPPGEDFASEDDYADAASDVWEPLLREAIVLADGDNHDGHWAPDGCKTCQKIARLKEALG